MEKSLILANEILKVLEHYGQTDQTAALEIALVCCRKPFLDIRNDEVRQEMVTDFIARAGEYSPAPKEADDPAPD